MGRLFSMGIGLTLFWIANLAWAQVIKPDEVSQSVRAGLEDLFTAKRSDLKVTRVDYHHDLEVKDGKIVWVVDPEVVRLSPGRRSVAVDVQVNGQKAATIYVQSVLQRVLSVPVARRTLQRKEIVSGSDIAWQKIEVNRPMLGLVKDEAEVIGMEVGQNIKEGTPLQSRWFAPPLAVNRGDSVRVSLIKGGLAIESVATALENGRVGNVIQLRNPDSHLRFEARITAPGKGQVSVW